MSRGKKYSENNRLIDIGPEGMLPALLAIILFLFLLTPFIINDNSKQKVRSSQKVELSSAICPCRGGGI